MSASRLLRTLLVSCALLVAAGHSQAALTIEPSALPQYIDSRSPNSPVGYYDLLMDDGYHMFFTFKDGAADAAYRDWTARTLRNRLQPALDRLACADTSTVGPKSDPTWSEYRRDGGNLIVHLRSLSDSDYSVDATFWGGTDVCQ